MYRALRTLHKVSGLVGSAFLMVIAVTGFLLAIKGRVEAIRPATRQGGAVVSMAEVAHPERVLAAAYGVGLAELRDVSDVRRFEYHVDKNVYKVLSARGYREVQVDGATGRVLSVGLRNDQRFEDLHDLSLVHPALRSTLLPVVAVLLFGLGASGVAMYFVPIVRRRRHRASRS
jgi:uncharacterized iron-regulated membrane protein